MRLGAVFVRRGAALRSFFSMGEKHEKGVKTVDAGGKRLTFFPEMRKIINN